MARPAQQQSLQDSTHDAEFPTMDTDQGPRKIPEIQVQALGATVAFLDGQYRRIGANKLPM